MPDFEKALTGNVKGKKIGIPKEYRPEGLNPEIAALARQRTLGFFARYVAGDEQKAAEGAST